ncbi:MAG: ABC transporter substrate-binding protein [Sedimentisphaerales bacterium]
MRTRHVLLFIASFLAFIPVGCKRSSPQNANEMVLHHVIYTKIKTLDPLSLRDVYGATIMFQIGEPLYQYHFLKRPYVLVPLLAEDMPQISEDRCTYTVKIKKGVRFQDDACFKIGKGRELKADDFVYALKRIANVKNVSENWSVFDNRIVGLNEFREYTKTCKTAAEIDYSRPVEGLYAADDYTLVIKLTKPWPQIIGSAMADQVFMPVAKEAVDYYGKDIVAHPVGTGPFKLKVWQRASYIELVRNPNFRGETYPTEGEPGDKEAGYLDDAGKPIPFADKVTWTIIEEYQPAWLLFMQGKLDISAVPKDNYSEVFSGPGVLTEEMKQRNIRLETFDEPSVFWIGFNMDDPVLGKNKPLRQAISHAIDRQKFIDLFFNGRDKIAHGIIHPMMAGYDPNIVNKGFAAYDPNEARELLKQAEQIQGGPIPELKVANPGTDTTSRQMGQFINMQLEDIGLKVEILYMDWPTFQEKINTASEQMFFYGGFASIPDAMDFLDMFYSKNKPPGSNKFSYNNPEFDRIFDQASVMLDSPQRTELYRKMEMLVLEDCPAAFLNHRVNYVLHYNWYKNYKPNVFNYGVSKYLRVDLKERAEYDKLLKSRKD